MRRTIAAVSFVLAAGALPAAAESAPATATGQADATLSAAPSPAPDVQGAPAQPGQLPAAPPAVVKPQTAEAPADSPADIVVPDEIIVAGQVEATPGDPLEKVNAQSFELTQDVDRAVVGPVSDAYRQAVPEPVRNGLRNLLSNLTEPVVFLNYLLQLKPGKAAETLGRFGVNSTIGGAGLFDVAKRKPFKLPHRPNGFAYTLGYYGVKPGAFLFLPLVGPTTVRDLIGGGIDRLILPNAIGVPFNRIEYSVSTGILSSLDRRVEIDARLREFRNKSYDPYKAFREYYLYKRQAEIDALHGRAPSIPAPVDGQPAAAALP